VSVATDKPDTRTRMTVICPLNFCNWHFRAEGDTYVEADRIGKIKERQHWDEYHAHPRDSKEKA